MLKLKLQYFGHLMQRTDSLEKTLMLGKIDGERRNINNLRYADENTLIAESEETTEPLDESERGE